MININHTTLKIIQSSVRIGECPADALWKCTCTHQKMCVQVSKVGPNAHPWVKFGYGNQTSRNQSKYGFGDPLAVASGNGQVAFRPSIISDCSALVVESQAALAFNCTSDPFHKILKHGRSSPVNYGGGQVGSRPSISDRSASIVEHLATLTSNATPNPFHASLNHERSPLWATLPLGSRGSAVVDKDEHRRQQTGTLFIKERRNIHRDISTLTRGIKLSKIRAVKKSTS